MCVCLCVCIRVCVRVYARTRVCMWCQQPSPGVARRNQQRQHSNNRETLRHLPQVGSTTR